jgi:hypothetical protein
MRPKRCRVAATKNDDLRVHTVNVHDCDHFAHFSFRRFDGLNPGTGRPYVDIRIRICGSELRFLQRTNLDPVRLAPGEWGPPSFFAKERCHFVGSELRFSAKNEALTPCGSPSRPCAGRPRVPAKRRRDVSSGALTRHEALVMVQLTPCERLDRSPLRVT